LVYAGSCRTETGVRGRWCDRSARCTTSVCWPARTDDPCAKRLITNSPRTNQHQENLSLDPVLLEFLGLPNTGKLLESGLEQSLIENLQAFLLELGQRLCLRRTTTAHQHRLQGLLCGPDLLQLPPENASCFSTSKTGELTHQDIGQMDMYVRIYDGPEAQFRGQPNCRHHPLCPKGCFRSPVLRASKVTNNSLPASTGLCCHRKKNCEPNWIANNDSYWVKVSHPVRNTDGPYERFQRRLSALLCWPSCLRFRDSAVLSVIFNHDLSNQGPRPFPLRT